MRNSRDGNLLVLALNVAVGNSKIGKKTNMSGLWLWLSAQCYSGKKNEIYRGY